MTPEQLVGATRISQVTADFWAPILTMTCDRFGIGSLTQQAGFVAQAAHESANFSRLVESMTYKSADRLMKVFPRYFKTLTEAAPYVRNPVALGDLVYAPRGTTLPESSGGGHRRRGRGLFMVTWLENYRRVGQGLGLDLINKPGLREEPVHAAASAGWWWMDLDLNRYADTFEIDRITRAINGPAMLGKLERAQTFERAIRAFA